MLNIFTFSYCLKSGGAERQLAFLSDELMKNYNCITVVFDSKKNDYNVKSKIISLKIPLPPYRNRLEYILYLIIATIKLFFLKIKYKPVCTISFLDMPNYANIFSLIGKKICKVDFVKSSIFKNGMIIKKIVSLVYSFSNLIVANSYCVKNDLVLNFKFNSDKVIVIYNIFDFNKINKLSNSELKLEHENIFKKDVLLAVGRLSWDKTQWYIIKSFDIVKEKFPDVHLVFLGDGPMLPYLRRHASCSKYPSDIHFFGFESNPFCYMKKAKILVHSSPFEGFGNIFVEAMACSLPIVAADCLSSREILFFEDINQYDDLIIGSCGIQVRAVRWRFIELDSLPSESVNIAMGTRLSGLAISS